MRKLMPRAVYNTLNARGQQLCASIVAAEGEQLDLGFKPGGSRVVRHKLTLERIQRARSQGFGSGTGFWPPKL